MHDTWINRKTIFNYGLDFTMWEHWMEMYAEGIEEYVRIKL